MPWIYAGYWALLPLWPQVSPLSYLFPYTPPDVNARLAEDFNLRALLMFGLIVSLLILGLTTLDDNVINALNRHCGCSG
jgi:hypothetical protein